MSCGTASALTFILAGGEGRRLYPLTRTRAKPLIPIGGIHRLLDFTLSNCFNSGLRRVYILTQYQGESVHSRRNTSHDFARDIIPTLVQSRRVSVYNFTEMGTRLGSYWRDVGTLDAYYRVNMELLSISLGDPNAVAWPLCGLDANRCAGPVVRNGSCMGWVLDSFIARGVAVGRGSRVVHSVLSPGVQIGQSAQTRNAILLNNVHVGAGARIQRAIVDESVRIADGVEIGYDWNRDRDYGFLTENGVVVIPAHTCVEKTKASPERRIEEYAL